MKPQTISLRSVICWALLVLVTTSQAATRIWTGNADPVDQIDTIVFGGTWAAGEVFVIECNNKQIILTLGATMDTTTELAAGVAEAIEQTSHDAGDLSADMSLNRGGYEVGEFRDMTATVSGSTVYVRSAYSGVPFDITIDASDSSSGTATLTSDGTGESQVATGPLFFDNGDNWGGTAPTTGDTLIYAQGDQDCKYNLGNGGNDMQLYVYDAWTGDLGLTKIYDAPSGYDYPEYRTPRHLAMTCTTTTGVTRVFIGDQVPTTTASGIRYVDMGTNTGTTTAINVYNAAAAGTDGPAVQVLGGRTMDVLVSGGTVGFGMKPDGNASHFDTLQIVSRSTLVTPAVTLAEQTTLNSGSTVTVSGGTLTANTNGSNATLQLYGGTTTWTNTSNCASAAHVRNGATLKNYAGAITSLYVYGGGTLDASKSVAWTATNATAYPGAIINDSQGAITYSNGLDIVGGGVTDITWTTEDSLTLTPSAL